LDSGAAVPAAFSAFLQWLARPSEAFPDKRADGADAAAKERRLMVSRAPRAAAPFFGHFAEFVNLLQIRSAPNSTPARLPPVAINY
jgi:hypothetical protein